jgi:hypothetical protein
MLLDREKACWQAGGTRTLKCGLQDSELALRTFVPMFHPEFLILTLDCSRLFQPNAAVRPVEVAYMKGSAKWV